MPSPLPRNPTLEHAAFTRPDDLDAWRVYADWLQSQGDPRGERVMLSLDARDGFLSQRREIASKLAEAERDEQREWKAWAKQIDAGALEFGFERGLLQSVKGTLAKLGPHLDTLFEHAPIHKLTLSHCKPADVITLFGRAPTWLAQLRYLKFEASPKLDAKSLAALASNPLPELDGINLTACSIGAQGCAALAELDTRKLTRVVLTANEIDDEALDVLLAAEHRTQWRKLYLTQNPITDEGIARLVGDEGLAGLEQLFAQNLEDAQFDAFAPLAKPKLLPGLRVLEVSAGWNANREVMKALRARFGRGLRT